MGKDQTCATSYKPPHWPSNIEYIQRCQYHSSVPQDIRTFLLEGQADPPAEVAKVGRPSVIIKLISDKSHPAHGQHGLFATRKIAPKTHIIDYLGEVHCDDRSESDYDLSLYRTKEGMSVGIDALKKGNEARFINDYRGVKTKSNAEFKEIRSGSGEMRMSVFTQKEGIKKGDEILISYGKSWWNSRLSLR